MTESRPDRPIPVACASRNDGRGFTLIELVVVLTIIGIAAAMMVVRTDAFSFWKEEGFLRKFVETIQFLHYQAIQDGEHYQLEISFEENAYRVGVLKNEETDDTGVLDDVSPDAGALSLELASVLNPSFGRTYTIIPPPLFPSLFEPVYFPEGVELEDVRTMRGLKTAREFTKADMVFSPRGFSEFAVIHLRMAGDQPVTILVNPFTGLAEIFRSYKEFEWTYGRAKK